MSDVPPGPVAKKVRSCSSSESTNPTVSLDENAYAAASLTAVASATPTAAPVAVPGASLLEAARKYEAEAVRRNNQAQAEVSSAKEEVLTAMETLKRAHERLGRVERVAEEADASLKTAKEYLAKWEAQLLGGVALKKPGAAVAEENDDDQKHVSFAPQHLTAEVGSSSMVSLQRKVKRKRIRVSEHGWGVYEGMLDTLGEPHGRGTVSWENGGKYEGEWVDGKANGHGTMHYGNGDRYEGGWKDGSRFGVGTHHFKDGGVYQGEWRNAAPDGKGKMTLKNGSHYEGSWKDGKWHGHGIVRPVNGGEWEGNFELGKCTVGTLRRPNGELEIGRYDSVNPDDVKEGVWWSIDRQTIWSIESGQRKEVIDLVTAYDIASKIGVRLPSEVSASAPP